MIHSGPVILGSILIIFGLVMALLTHYLLHTIPERYSQPQPGPNHLASKDVPSHSDDAVLLIKAGGRVAFTNFKAQELFNLRDKEASIDRLASRARPSDTFLELCAMEGKAHFSLNGRMVEGNSYHIPYNSHHAVLVSIRQSQLTSEGSKDDGETVGLTKHAYSIFTEFSQAVSTSQDMETTLQAILESIEGLIPADAVEITILDSAHGCLIPYRLLGVPNVDRHLEKGGTPYAMEKGYSGYIASQQKPLLVNDADTFRDVRPAGGRDQFPYNAFLGVPLIVGGEFIGTLEMASLSEDAFTRSDLEVLQILSAQASIAVHNARLHEEEERRVLELTGLAKLAQAISAIRDPDDLYAHLVDSIAPLLDVEILGFLVFDDNRRTLEGKLPFLGLQPSIIEWNSTTIHPGTRAEEIWLSQEAILSEDAPADERIQALGLHHLAQAAGIHHIILTPLTSAGRMVGYLQAANKRDGTPFDQDEQRLLAIIAGQAAPIIENSGLIQHSRHRAQRAETLRRIASLTSSTATLDEILQHSLTDLARLIGAEHGAVFLLDETHGELRLNRNALVGIPADAVADLSRLSTDDPQYYFTATGKQKPYINTEVSDDERLVPFYQELVDNLGIHSLIIAPLVVRDHGIGEILLASPEPDHFNQGDAKTVITASGQLATAIEHISLYNQTDETLRQKVEQLTAISRISRELNSTLDLQYLLRRVYDEALRTTQADCGAILLFELDEASSQTETQTSPSPRILLHLGDHPGAELHPAEIAVVESGTPLVIRDFERLDDSHLPASLVSTPALKPAHPGIRSAIVVPIAYQDRVAGLIHLHAREPNRFGPSALNVTETLAIQSAIALGNAHRFQEQAHRSALLKRRVETLSRLLETSQTLQAELPLEEALENIAQAIQSATPFERILISLFNADTNALTRIAAAGLRSTEMEQLKAHPQSWDSVQKMLKSEFCLGPSYFIPYEKMPVKPPDVHIVTVLPMDGGQNRRHAAEENLWHPEDILVIPLKQGGDDPLGLISVDAPRDNLRPDRTTIETLEIFASQATLIIDSQQKLLHLRREVEQAENRLHIALDNQKKSQELMPFLLHKDLEQTLSVQKLNQRSIRSQAGLEILQTVSRQTDRSSVLELFSRQLLLKFGLDVAIVVEPSLHGPRLIHTEGKTPPNINIRALLGQRSPLHKALVNGENMLVYHLEGDSPWSDSPLLQFLGAQSFVCLSIPSSPGGVDASILAISRTSLAPFSPQDDRLFDLITAQIAGILQRLYLVEETNRRLDEARLLLDFSQQLSSLKPTLILKTLVEKALQVVPEAQASMVALWDEKEKRLKPRAAAGYADKSKLMAVSYRKGEGMPGEVFEKGQAARLDEVDFASHYHLSSSNLLHYRDATDGKLPISSLAVPIQRAANAPLLGVLVLDNFKISSAFTAQDESQITSLTQQTALNMENTRLYRAAEQRASQLQALTDVAATITSSLHPEELTPTLLSQLASILPYDTGTLWLRQDGAMVIHAAQGFEDSEQRLGLSAALEDSQMMKEMITTGKAICVEDITQDQRFAPLVDHNYRSWLGLPLIASGEVIGVIALEKSPPHYYTPEHIQIGTTFASQAAVALENANLYKESVDRALQLDQRTHRLEALNRFSTALSETMDPDLVIDITLKELSQAVSCTGVTAVAFDSNSGSQVVAEAPQTSPRLPLRLISSPIFERQRESYGVFIASDVRQEPDLSPMLDYLESRNTTSLLVLPLATGSDLIGVLLAHNDHPYHFTTDEVGLANTIANQAALAIQNARLTRNLENLVRERTTQLAQEHKRTQILLQIITELSASLDIEQVLTRTLKVLNEFTDAAQISVLIMRPGEEELRLLTAIGENRQVLKQNWLSGKDPQGSITGRVFASQEPILLGDVQTDPTWDRVSLDTRGQVRSLLAVPLVVGAETLGAMIFLHPDPNHFSLDQLDLVTAAAKQIAVSVNNAELFRLIRDQAEDLGNMVRLQQVETSRSQAIVEDIADGVLVTDGNRDITMFNGSAEEILSLDRTQVIGKSLEYFTGLFGQAAQTWMETINNWSQNPASISNSDVYAEQINLEDGRVVSVHLAPVSMQNDFLGTVSIFRDITHQVEVDKLKSEFVATVSHELRTPMTSIKGYVDVLLMGAAGLLNEQQLHFLGIVKNNTERLAVLVNDLLDISRIEAGRLNLSWQAIDMDELIKKTVHNLSLRTQEENKSMDIEVLSSQHALLAYGDLERVRQILENLLDNAYHYTPEQGRITVCLSQVDQEIQVDVQDTGIGISPELHERVFERFYRGEHPFVLSTSGTGLGLSIVKHLVEMHNGRLWLKSSGVFGEGSTFSFTLPLYSPENNN
jgi:PAS domain S-box-containing protein